MHCGTWVLISLLGNSKSEFYMVFEISNFECSLYSILPDLACLTELIFQSLKDKVRYGQNRVKMICWYASYQSPLSLHFDKCHEDRKRWYTPHCAACEIVNLIFNYFYYYYSHYDCYSQ